MKKVMNIFLLSCQKATELIEKKMYVGNLSKSDEIKLKAHKVMCKACSNYEKQSILIEKSVVKLQKKDFTEHDLSLLKSSIINKLENM